MIKNFYAHKNQQDHLFHFKQRIDFLCVSEQTSIESKKYQRSSLCHHGGHVRPVLSDRSGPLIRIQKRKAPRKSGAFLYPGDSAAAVRQHAAVCAEGILLLGLKATTVYKIVFTVATFGGAVMGQNLAWDIADTLNGLMAIPNLIGVLALSGTVAAITKNYVDRTFHGKKVKPMLSAFDDVQAEQEDSLRAHSGVLANSRG